MPRAHLVQPSFAQGFARSAALSAHAHRWRGLRGAWMPALGPSGLSLFDIAGARNHGTLVAMTATSDWLVTTFGQFQRGGYVLDFPGGSTGSRVEIPNYDGLTDQLTLICFALSRSGNTQFEHMCSRHPGWFLSRDDTIPSIRFGVRTSSEVNVSFGTDTKDTWIHYTGVYDGAEMRTYVDGVFQNSASQSGNINLTGETRIGTYWDNPTSGLFTWDGQIALSLLYDIALPEALIMEHAHDPFGLFRRRARPLAAAGGPVAAPQITGAFQLSASGGMIGAQII